MLLATTDVVLSTRGIVLLAVYVLGFLVSLAIGYDSDKEFDFEDCITHYLPLLLLALLWPLIAVFGIVGLIIVGIFWLIGAIGYGLARVSTYGFEPLVSVLEWTLMCFSGLVRKCRRAFRRKGETPMRSRAGELVTP